MTQNRVMFGKGDVVAKEPTILFDDRNNFLKIFTGLFAVLIGTMCLVASQGVFAGQSEKPSSTAIRIYQDKERVRSSMSAGQDRVVKQEVTNDSWQVVRMRVTAYCPCSKCCGDYADGITACNHRIQRGDKFVAADKTYSFGTEMIIPGYNSGQPVKVLDRGGAIKGDRLDAFFDTHQQALEWGVRYLDVRVKVQ